MSLNQLEVRILGSLVEKERTTPESYPLSTNALVLACNQKSNREPVANYHRQEIEDGIRALVDKGLVKSVMADGERAVKHRHLLADALGINKYDMAVLAVLMLRGPQTSGELRTRTERYVDFRSLAQVEESLARLAAHQPQLARNTGRSPGQSQDRWVDTFNPDPDKQRPRIRSNGRRPENVETAQADPDSSDGMRRLQAEIDYLYEHLKLQKPTAD